MILRILVFHISGIPKFQTAEDLYFILKDFIEVYPEFKGRPFYITGKNYWKAL